MDEESKLRSDSDIRTDFADVSQMLGCEFSPGLFITRRFDSFLYGMFSMTKQASSTLNLLSAMEVMPRNSIEKKCYFFPINEGSTIDYDGTGRILRISSSKPGYIEGSTLNLVAGARSRNGQLIFATDSSVCLSAFYQTRTVKEKIYLQLATGCCRALNKDVDFEPVTEMYLKLLLIYLGNITPSLIMLNVVKELSEDLLLALNDLAKRDETKEPTLLIMKTIMKKYIDKTGAENGGDEIEGAEGLVAKFLNGLEGLVVARMDNSELRGYLKNITKVRRLAQLLPLLSFKLPRTVNQKSPLLGKDEDNKITVSSIDNVAPGSFVLTEKQKSTPAAVRTFLALKSVDVYSSTIEDPILKDKSSIGGKRKKGTIAKTHKSSVHTTQQASMFHAIRDGIIVGAVEPRNTPADLKPATGTAFTF